MRVPFIGDIGQQREEKDKVGKLQELYLTADEQRKKFEAEWWTNILWLGGAQYEEADPDVRRFRKIPIKTADTKIKFVSNFTYSLARQAAAGLRDTIARCIAMPATLDPEDVFAADLGTDFLDSRIGEDEEQELRFDEILACMVFGRVLRKTYWDPDKDAVGYGGEPIHGAGDIATVTLSPLQCHWTPWARTWNEVTFVIESSVRDVGEVNDLYPGHDVKSEEYQDVTRIMDDMLSNVTGWIRSGAPRRKDGVILKVVQFRPTKKYKRGRQIVWANGKWLDEGELPEGELSYVPLDWFHIPGRWSPLPFITPLRDPQKEYNFTVSQLIELKNRQLRGDIILEGYGEVTQDSDPITKAKRIRVPPASNARLMEYNLSAVEAERLLARFIDDARQAAGIREPSLGEYPGRETPAALAIVLKEADIQGLTVFRKGFDLAHCKIARQKLILARNHYKVPRMLRAVGQNRVLAANAFFGADLRNTQDVRPKALPFLTEAQQIQARQEAITAGLYGPYQGPKDKLAKLEALLNTNLPGIEDEVQEKLGQGMTLQDLRAIVAQIDNEEAKLMLAATKARTIGIVAQIEEELSRPQEGEGAPQEPVGAGVGV